MEQALKQAKGFGGPVIVHAITRKGFGYDPAERNEIDQLHQTDPFDVVTHEPGGTPLGDALRSVFLDSRWGAVDGVVELLLVFASRRQHLLQVIEPALAAGQHVLCDRFTDSTRAYQGYGRGLPLDEVRQINEWAMGDIWPDLVVLLTIPADVTAERMRRRQLDRFEQAGDDFHARVDRGFARMAELEPQRWAVVDATRPKDEVAAAIRAVVQERLAL